MKEIVIFCDGACSGNPGPGGWGAILHSPQGKVVELGGSSPATTNNRMELTAAIESLEKLLKFKTLSVRDVQLFTDSKYLIQGITQWIHNWKSRGWKNSTGDNVANQDLWLKLDQLIATSDLFVRWNYVPAHVGIGANERVDEIAVAFSKNEEARLYQGESSGYRIPILENARDLLANMQNDKSAPPKAKEKPYYLSYVDGQLHRDHSWNECEARVKGRAGVKYKKVKSSDEEKEVLKTWKVSSGS